MRWAALRGFERTHEVSTDGTVRRISACPKIRVVPHVLSAVKDKDGYLNVSVQDGKKRKTFKCHRLVAEHFIENPDGLCDVNHIDGVKHNNDMSNLEWVSHSENHTHRVCILRKGIKKYEVTHPNGHVEVIENLSEFSRTIGVPRTQLLNTARGGQKTAHGFRVKGPLS